MSVVTIIGMHRSGTSCLTGSLQSSGLFSGEVVESAPFNKKGNRENLEIRSLNDEVLNYNKGFWNRPPEKLIWTSELEKKRDKLIDQFYLQAKAWLFKDPRTTLTLPFWRAGIQDLTLVGVFRQPLAVAKSLMNREKITLQEAIKLWCAYNERVIAQISEQYFPLLSFDISRNEFIRQIECIVFWLQEKLKNKVILNADKCHLFYDITLIHNAPISSLDVIFQNLYSSLLPDKKLSKHTIAIYTTLLEKMRVSNFAFNSSEHCTINHV